MNKQIKKIVEIIETTAYDTYKLIDLAHQGMLSDRDNDPSARYNLTRYYQLCVDWMDDNIREQLHGSDGLDTDAKFLRAYCVAHEKKFKQDFFVDY